MEYRKRILLGLAISGAFVCCGGGGFALYFGLRYFDFPAAAGEADSAAAAYRKAGLPWEAKDLAPNPPIKESENAAPLLKQTFAVFNHKKFLTEREQFGKQIDAGDTRKAEATTSEYQAGLALAKGASRRPRLDFARDWDLGYKLLFPEIGWMKVLVQALSIDAEIAAKGGDRERTVEDLASANRLSHLIGQEPTVLSMLAQISGERIVLSSAERCAASFQADPTALESIAKSTAESDSEPKFGRSLIGDCYMGLATVRNLESFTKDRDREDETPDAEKPIDRGTIKRTGLPDLMITRGIAARFFQAWTRAKVAIDKNPDDVDKIAAAVKQISDDIESKPGVSNMLMDALFPTYFSAGRSVTVLRADHLVKAALMSAMAMHARTGKWPTRIEDIPGTWIDPFAGAPLKIKASNSGIRIYSLGPNRKDDGGTRVREIVKTDGVNYDVVGAFPPIPRQERI